MSVAVIDECGCLMLMLIPVGIFKREREPISVQYVQESVHLVASHTYIYIYICIYIYAYIYIYVYIYIYLNYFLITVTMSLLLTTSSNFI